MTALLFDGNKYVIQKNIDLGKKIEILKKKNIIPQLSWINIGDNKANKFFGDLKEKAANNLNINFQRFELPSKFPLIKIIKLISKLNHDSKINGIMIQLPIYLDNEKAKSYDISQILLAIDPKKDIDCLTPQNLGQILIGHPVYLPATVQAILDVLNNFCLNHKKTNFNEFIKGKRISIIGGSIEVNRPLVCLLSNLGATIFWIRSHEKFPQDILIKSDIIITAVGKINLINGKNLQKDVIVIDIGFPKGDCHKKSVIKKSVFFTPVPGGIGPVTITCLFKNLIQATLNQHKLELFNYEN